MALMNMLFENHQDHGLSDIHYYLSGLSVSGMNSWLPSVKRKLGYRSTGIGSRSHIDGMHGNITLFWKMELKRQKSGMQNNRTAKYMPSYNSHSTSRTSVVEAIGSAHGTPMILNETRRVLVNWLSSYLAVARSPLVASFVVKHQIECTQMMAL